MANKKNSSKANEASQPNRLDNSDVTLGPQKRVPTVWVFAAVLTPFVVEPERREKDEGVEIPAVF